MTTQSDAAFAEAFNAGLTANDNNPGGIQPWSKQGEDYVIFALTEYTQRIAGGNKVSAKELARDLIQSVQCKATRVAGVWEGVSEEAWLVSRADFELWISSDLEFAICEEQCVLVLTGDYDSRARRRAYTTACYYDLDIGQQAIGYFGSIPTAEGELYDGLTVSNGVTYTALSTADWQKREALLAEGADLLELGADWRNASKLWTCATGVYGDNRTPVDAAGIDAEIAAANDNEPTRADWFGTAAE